MCWSEFLSNYLIYVVDGKPRNLYKPQEGKLPKEKVKTALFRRIVKKAMRHQPNAKVETGQAPPASEKKARREAKKLQIKMQKKAEKQKRR